ncbi:MAG: hypothetical protein M1144_00100 [Candidatus Thermoplasmatota archaeon]|nr:hypothetical protein [Candidatus Thermoplasmatota archaeon]
MGRTIPSFRQGLDVEIVRLERLAEGSADPRKRERLQRLLAHARDLENEYALERRGPGEEILLSLLLYLFSETEGTRRQEGPDALRRMDPGRPG